MRDSPRRGWRDRLASADRAGVAVLVAVVVAAVVAVGPGTLIGERTFSPVDVLTIIEPWQSFVQGEATNTAATDPVNAVMPKWEETTRRLQDGDLPLWSSLLGTGTPLTTLLQRGTLSPLNLPRYVLPQAVALGWVKLLEMALAGGFTFLFLRRLRLRRVPAVLAGFVFALSGFMVAWQGWQQTHVAAFIPVLFWAVERAVQQRRVAAAIPLALATAGIVLAGFPSLAGWSLQAAGAYALVRVVATRPDWRSRARTLAVLAGAVVAGLALTSVQLLPFADWLADRAMGDRSTFADRHLPLRALATLIAPEAFGNPSEKLTFGGTFIAYQAYVGLAAVVLAAAGAVFGSSRLRGTAGDGDTEDTDPDPAPATDTTRTTTTMRGVRGFFVGGVVVVGVLVYAGGPLLEALAPIPPYGTNLVTRQRVILGFFLAVLAAVGLDGLLAGWRITRRRLVAAAAVGIGLTGLFTIALRRAGGRAAEAGASGYFAGEVVELAVVAVAVVAGIALVRRRPTAGLAVLAGAVLVPAVAFATDYWATPDAELHYPDTPAHAFLAERLGEQRLAAAGRAMEPGTTQVYGLPSVTYHGFQLPRSADLLNLVTPEALARHSFPTFAPGARTATSPVLDRLAASHYVAADTEPVIGERPDPPEPDTMVRLPIGAEVAVPAPPGRLRAVTVHAHRIHTEPGVRPWLTARLRTAGGEVLAAGSRRIHGRVRPGPVDLGLVWADGGGAREAPPGATVQITLSMHDAAYPGADDGGPAATGPPPAGRLELVAGGRDLPAVTPVRADDDGLTLVFAAGVHVYARAGVLPRVRWAADPVLVPERTDRLAALTSGELGADQVLVEQQVPPTDPGASAELTTVAAGGDGLTVDVAAEGAGLLVVADALTEDGWGATVDGAPAPILPADHGLAAVHVPAGAHRVVFSYRPPLLGLGAALSALAALALAAVALYGRRTRRRPTGP